MIIEPGAAKGRRRARMEREIARNILKEASKQDEALSKAAIDDTVYSQIVSNSVGPTTIGPFMCELKC